jgi:hypothetical protein
MWLDSTDYLLARPKEEPTAENIILDDNIAAKIAAQQWVSGNTGKTGSGTQMWWIERFKMDNWRVEGIAVCVNRHGEQFSAVTLLQKEWRYLMPDYGQLVLDLESPAPVHSHCRHLES